MKNSQLVFSMDDLKKLNGRPKLENGKRTKFINVRFTEKEYKTVEELEIELGISKTELIRQRILSNADKTVVNAKVLIKSLDDIGAELGRVGNNINQLARHANTLKLQNALNPIVVEKYNQLFEDYIQVQQSLETALRKMLRSMGK